MTLDYAEGFPDNYYVCLLIMYRGEWVRDLPGQDNDGTTDGTKMDLTELVNNYENNLNVNLIDNDGNKFLSNTYSGGDFNPKLLVTCQDETLNSDNYTYSWMKNGDSFDEKIIDAGTYTCIVEGTGKYEGKSGSAIFTVLPKSIYNASVNLLCDQSLYDGTDKHPEIESVTLDGETLKKDKDYEVSGLSVKDVGTYYIYVRGKNNYIGNTYGNYTIAQAEISGTEKQTMSIVQGFENAFTALDDSIIWGGESVNGSWTYSLGKLNNLAAINTAIAEMKSGDTCTVTATFTPAVDGNYTGEYTRTYNVTIKEPPVVIIPPSVTNPPAPSQVTTPEITLHPVAANVKAGEPVTFSVSTKESGPVSYQWQKNDGSGWVDIESAQAAEYRILSVTEDQNGERYRCIITNEAGSCISDPVSLKVEKTMEPITPVDPTVPPKPVSPVNPLKPINTANKDNPSVLKETTSPLTGDYLDLCPWTCTGILSLFGIIITVAYQRKRRRTSFEK